MNLIFATHNSHKISEIKKLLPEKIKIRDLKQIRFNDEIVEDGKTLEENAKIKSEYIYKKYKSNCFSDDSGLFIDAISGEPGVYSARYAGLKKNSEKNISKVLSKLKNITNRNAKFVTVISLFLNDKNYIFKGEIKGLISKRKIGLNGFGYDPIFIPYGFNQTFSQMNLNTKNMISHRAIAFKKLVKFLTDF
tara:strand:+ start:2196 stop:2771 length:576 start_codon:yes stop_codon:yes gene_type:complete